MRAGGKQYRIERNQLLDVDRIQAEIGSIVELNDVLMISGNGPAKVGNPLVDGARVIAEVVEHGRDKKISVFKYKSKVRYRRRHGHRQDFTRLAIRGILGAGDEVEEVIEEKPKRPARNRPAPKAKTVAPVRSMEEAAVAVAPTIEAAADVKDPAEAGAGAKPQRAKRAPRPSKPVEATAEKPAARPRRKKAASTDESGA